MKKLFIIFIATALAPLSLLASQKSQKEASTIINVKFYRSLKQVTYQVPVTSSDTIGTLKQKISESSIHIYGSPVSAKNLKIKSKVLQKAYLSRYEPDNTLISSVNLFSIECYKVS